MVIRAFKNRSMSLANSVSLNSPFAIWMPLLSFSCLIAVTNTLSTILNGSGKIVSSSREPS